MVFLKFKNMSRIIAGLMIFSIIISLNIHGAASSSTSSTRIRSSAVLEADGSPTGNELADALMYNKAQFALELAKQEFDVNAQILGQSLLYLSVEKPEFLEIAKELLKNGAKVDLANETDGETPLMNAIKTGNEAMVDLLLEHGANVNAKCKLNVTPLQVTILRGGCTEIAKKLIAGGAEVNPKDACVFKPFDRSTDESLDTLLKLALDYLRMHEKSKKEKFVELIEILKKAGAV